MVRDPPRLRIGCSAASPIGTEVHPEAVAAVNDAAKLLRDLGHEVEAAAPEIDGAALAKSFLHVYFGQVPAMVAQAGARPAQNQRISNCSRASLATLGGATSAGALTTQLLEWNDFARALARFHQRYDLLLTPTVAHPRDRAWRGRSAPVEQMVLDLLDRIGLLGLLARMGALDKTIDKIARDNLQYVPFTQLANLTGTPAMSVPLHWTADGLPLGVQFVARLSEEDRLLQLGRQLEPRGRGSGRLPAWVGQGRRVAAPATSPARGGGRRARRAWRVGEASQHGQCELAERPRPQPSPKAWERGRSRPRLEVVSGFSGMPTWRRCLRGAARHARLTMSAMRARMSNGNGPTLRMLMSI